MMEAVSLVSVQDDVFHYSNLPEFQFVTEAIHKLS